jgi:hypothetical protein
MKPLLLLNCPPEIVWRRDLASLQPKSHKREIKIDKQATVLSGGGLKPSYAFRQWVDAEDFIALRKTLSHIGHFSNNDQSFRLYRSEATKDSSDDKPHGCIL